MTKDELEYEFSVGLAGYVIGVRACYSTAEFVCRDFAVSAEEPVDVRIEVPFADILREAKRCGEPITEADLPEQGPYFESVALHRMLAEALIPLDVLQLHGSTITVDGQAYLFTAPSGTGKSTHTSLWRERFGSRAVMVNDDKPLIRVEADRVLACGSPWNGKHRLGNNVQVPLRGICFLERNEENVIRRLSPEDAFSYVYKQTHRPEDPILAAKTVEVLSRMLAQVPVYIMGMNNYRDDAVDVSYRAMS